MFRDFLNFNSCNFCIYGYVDLKLAEILQNGVTYIVLKFCQKSGQFEFLITSFSKSVLDIRTRLVVAVEPEIKLMPKSDSASKLMPKYKILDQYNLPNYFYSCLKIAVF